MSSCCSSAEATRSRRPARMPEACGPPSALPPEKATRSAPMAMKRLRFSLGGSCAAASTISGMPLARHTAATVGRSARLVALAEKATATTRRRQRRLDLPGFQPAHAGAGAAVVVADIDQPRARCRQRMRVAGAMGARQQDVARRNRRAAAPPSSPRPSARSTRRRPGSAPRPHRSSPAPPRRPSPRRCARWRRPAVRRYRPRRATRRPSPRRLPAPSPRRPAGSARRRH